MREELKEGDLIFFNTRGGVSHVGIYLQNNKFVHSSTSEGVTITDLDDGYWSKRIVGYGRYAKPQENILAVGSLPNFRSPCILITQSKVLILRSLSMDAV